MHATCKSARGNHETAFKVMPTFQWNYMDYLLALRVHRVGTYIDLKSSYSVSRKIFQDIHLLIFLQLEVFNIIQHEPLKVC